MTAHRAAATLPRLTAALLLVFCGRAPAAPASPPAESPTTAETRDLETATPASDDNRATETPVAAADVESQPPDEPTIASEASPASEAAAESTLAATSETDADSPAPAVAPAADLIALPPTPPPPPVEARDTERRRREAELLTRSQLEIQLAQQGVALQDMRRERRRLESLLDTVPVQVLAGRLGADELRQRLAKLVADSERFRQSYDTALQQMKAARARPVTPEAAPTRDELVVVLTQLAEAATAAHATSGELATLFRQALRRAPLTNLLQRASFPLSAETTASLYLALGAFKNPTTVQGGTPLGLDAAQLRAQLPGAVAALLASLAVLVLLSRRARRGREVTETHTTLAARREQIALAAGGHLVALLIAYLTLEVILAALVEAPWRGLCRETWLGWALWYSLGALAPWLTVLKPPAGSPPAAPRWRAGALPALRQALLLAAVVGPFLSLCRNLAGMPLEAVAVGELLFGFGLVALLTPVALVAGRTRQEDPASGRGTGWCVLAVVSAYLVLGCYLAGYHNLARYLAAAAPLSAAVALAAWSTFFAVSSWLGALVSRPQPDALEPWEQLLDGTLRRGLSVVPALAAGLVCLLLFPVTNLRTWHVHRGLELLQRPLFAVQGSRFSLFSAGKAAVVIYLAWWLARLVRDRLQHARFMRARYEAGVCYAAATVIYYVLLLAGVVTGFLAAGLNLGVFTIFSATLGLAVGFGSQDIAKNFISGLILILDRSVSVGDYVEVAGQEGTIEEINIRCTTIHTVDNRKVVVPNATFVAQNVIGSPSASRERRLMLEFPLTGAVDFEAAEALLIEAAAATEGILAEPKPEVWIAKLAPNSLTVQLAVWVARPEDHLQAQGRLLSAAWRRLREANLGVG